MRSRSTWGLVGVGLVLVSLGAMGCAKTDDKPAPAKDKDKPASTSKDAGKDKGDSKHAGFWCDEHGIPEAECSMCSGKVAAEFKKKGDWCDKHERALSQCFICKPEQREVYAAKYRVKTGKEPPEPTENRPPKKDKSDAPKKDEK